MKHKFLFAITLLFVAANAMALQLGEWTHHYSYNKLTHVVPTPNEVFAVSDGGLFSYNPNDDSMTAYNTTNLLNDNSRITDICWNQQTQCLVIAYENGNIDMLSTRDHSVVNAAAILNENTTRSKEIQSIACYGNNAYVVMPYGVVTLNTKKKEFGDTYRFNVDGSFYCAAVKNDSLFLINNGVMSQFNRSVAIAGKLSDNLLDNTNWMVPSWSRITQARANALDLMNARRIYNFQLTNNRNTDPIADTYHKCYWTISDTDGTLMKLALQEDGTYAQQWLNGRKPDGPATNSFWHIYWQYNKLYTPVRGWRLGMDSGESAYIETYQPSTGWTAFQYPTREELGFNFIAAGDIAVDPRDTAHVMVAAKSGLYEYYAGKFVKRWYNANSPIKAIYNGNSSTYQIILTARYDKNGTLWVFNSLSENALLRLDQTLVNGEATESKWQTLHHTELDMPDGSTKTNYISNARWDNNGNLWFINLFDYDIDFFSYNPTTDELTRYTPTYNQDGASLYDNSGEYSLKDINFDAEGNVWLCGTQGLSYLPAKQVGTSTNIVQQYKVARNDGSGLADYLLGTVDAQCIAFDQAGRKYVGTVGNGIYVISADNDTELENYTTENSGLMSNDVRGLAIDPSTGTLYCATDIGLCSVATDAVAVPNSLDESNIKVYPNPVTPDYTGMITIEGLTVGADLKITTATGYIVHEGRTQSALYQWDGCDKQGNRCASGVYNVLLSTADGSEGCVAKIAMVK